MSLKQILLLVLTITFQLSFSQNKDSLYTILNNKNFHDTVKIHTAYYLASLHVYTNSDSSEYYAKQGLLMSKSNKFLNGIGEGYGWLGYLNAEKGNIDEAIDYNLKSLNLAQKQNLKSDYPIILNNLATLYMDMGDFKQALNYYNQCVDLNKDLNKRKSLATNYNNIALVYRKMKQYNKAISFANKSLKIGETLKNNRLLSNAYSNIGSSYEALNYLDSAKLYYKSSYDLRKLQKSNRSIAMILGKLANLFYKTNNYGRAKVYAQESYNIAKKWGYTYELKEAHRILYKLYKQKGNTNNALFHLEQFKDLQDSLNSAENKQALVKSKFEFEYNKKQLVDSLEKEKIITSNQFLTQQNKLKEHKLFTQKIGLIFLVVIVVMLLLFLMLLRKHNKVKTEKLVSEIKVRLSETKTLKSELEKSKGQNLNQINTVLKEKLSEREQEILNLLILGLSNKEIGTRLFLSVNTIKTHILSLYHKLDVNNRTQAAVKGSLIGKINR